jgi:hypothetical protein
MAEIGAAFIRRTGIQAHRNNLADALAEAGMTRTRQPRTIADKQAEVGLDQSGRYGYARPITNRILSPATRVH